MDLVTKEFLDAFYCLFHGFKIMEKWCRSGIIVVKYYLIREIFYL